MFQVLPRGVRESNAKSISYWSTGNGDDTMVTVWNPADESQDFRFTLSFTGGHYQLSIHLEPRATRTFNISEVIQNQIPDEEGNIIPAIVHEGSAKIAGVHADNEEILVALDAGTYNVRKATCSYYCISCDGTLYVIPDITPFNMAKGATNQLYIYAAQNTGGGYYSSGTWSSTKTNVATVNNAGLAIGMSPGTSTFAANSNQDIYSSDYCAYDPFCPDVSNLYGSGPGTVGTVNVTNVAPSPLVAGSSGAMAISGSLFSSFGGTISVTFSGSGITVKNPTVVNDGLITASYNVASNTAVGSQNLTVSFGAYDGGSGAQSNAFPVSVTATAQGSVTGISPAQGLIGATQSNVTITGSGFGSTPTVNAGTGITVTYVSRSDTSITANFVVASSAPAGKHRVLVTTTTGAQLQPVDFYVQIPTHVQLFNQAPEAPGGRGPVIPVVNGTIYKLDGSVYATNQCGVYENFLFDIADQQGTQILNGTVYVTEVFSNITNPPGSTPSTNFAVNLASQGYEDLHARSRTYPTCLAYNENQTYDLTWTVKVGSVSATAYPVATSVYITKGNFNGTLNVTLTVTTP